MSTFCVDGYMHGVKTCRVQYRGMCMNDSGLSCWAGIRQRSAAKWDINICMYNRSLLLCRLWAWRHAALRRGESRAVIHGVWIRPRSMTGRQSQAALVPGTGTRHPPGLRTLIPAWSARRVFVANDSRKFGESPWSINSTDTWIWIYIYIILYIVEEITQESITSVVLFIFNISQASSKAENRQRPRKQIKTHTYI